jgi:hypothetical protein
VVTGFTFVRDVSTALGIVGVMVLAPIKKVGKPLALTAVGSFSRALRPRKLVTLTLQANISILRAIRSVIALAVSSIVGPAKQVKVLLGWVVRADFTILASGFGNRIIMPVRVKMERGIIRLRSWLH